MQPCGYAQKDNGLEIDGSLLLIDTPPKSTQVHALSVKILNLFTGWGIEALPDNKGRFTLKDVPPGRYSLELGMPARIVEFALGSRRLAPEGFEIRRVDSGPLRVVLSLESSPLIVEAQGIRAKAGEIVAVLSPSDPWLTLRASCKVSPVRYGTARFPYTQLGKYRVFVVDSALQGAVAKYSVRDRGFLREHAEIFEVIRRQENRVVAEYLDAATVQRAVQAAENAAKKTP